MTRTSPTTTLHRRNPGFTLIEILLVVAIIGLMAVMVLPKNFLSFVTPLRAMQRAVTEITEMALSGYSVRLRMEAADRSDRGRIMAETLTKVEDRFDPTKHTLEWRPIDIAHLPEGEDWRLEPEIVYFYSDGTCTPACFMRADRDVRITEGDIAMLTVTGFLFEPETQGERK